MHSLSALNLVPDKEDYWTYQLESLKYWHRQFCLPEILVMGSNMSLLGECKHVLGSECFMQLACCISKNNNNNTFNLRLLSKHTRTKSTRASNSSFSFVLHTLIWHHDGECVDSHYIHLSENVALKDRLPIRTFILHHHGKRTLQKGTGNYLNQLMQTKIIAAEMYNLKKNVRGIC